MIRTAPLVLILIATACSSEEGSIVSMHDDNRFDPSTVTVRAGETLRFVNDGAQAHTVTAYEDSLPDGSRYFTSGALEDEENARHNVGRALIAPGESFEVTLSMPGRARYFCIPHESQGMVGTVLVEDDRTSG